MAKAMRSAKRANRQDADAPKPFGEAVADYLREERISNRVGRAFDKREYVSDPASLERCRKALYRATNRFFSAGAAAFAAPAVSISDVARKIDIAFELGFDDLPDDLWANLAAEIERLARWSPRGPSDAPPDEMECAQRIMARLRCEQLFDRFAEMETQGGEAGCQFLPQGVIGRLYEACAVEALDFLSLPAPNLDVLAAQVAIGDTIRPGSCGETYFYSLMERAKELAAGESDRLARAEEAARFQDNLGRYVRLFERMDDFDRNVFLPFLEWDEHLRTIGARRPLSALHDILEESCGTSEWYEARNELLKTPPPMNVEALALIVCMCTIDGVELQDFAYAAARSVLDRGSLDVSHPAFNSAMNRGPARQSPPPGSFRFNLEVARALRRLLDEAGASYPLPAGMESELIHASGEANMALLNSEAPDAIGMLEKFRHIAEPGRQFDEWSALGLADMLDEAGRLIERERNAA